MQTVEPVLPILLFIAAAAGLVVLLFVLGNVFNPGRVTRVKQMPYESGMDPIHDTRRRFDVRFHLLAIAFLVFDVELLFLYPWAVVFRPEVDLALPVPAIQASVGEPEIDSDTPDGTLAVSELTASAPTISAAVPSAAVATSESDGGRPPFIFASGMIFVMLLALGFIYDWRKGIFQWR